MAGSVNKVILVGRVGKDPEVRDVNNGSVANFTVATSETWKDKRSGERQEKTEWHNVVVWNEHNVKFVEDYVNKGDLLYIEGQLQTRKWEDKDGVTRYTTEVVVPAFGGSVQLVHSKDSGNRDDDRGGDRDDRGSRGGRGRNDRDRGDDRDNGRDDDRRSSRGRNNDRDDDRGRGRGRNSDDDDRGSRGRGGSSGRSSGRSNNNDDLNDDIPF